MNNTIAFIKKLKQEGYTQKQVRLITKESQSRIQRVFSGSSYRSISFRDYIFDGALELRLHTLKTFLAAPEIAGYGVLKDNDIAYIKILKDIGVDYSRVRYIYHDRSLAELRPTWNFANQKKVPMFDAAQLNLRQDVVDDMFGHLF